MNLISSKYEKSKIVPSLKLLADEPDYESDLFGYKEYTEQLYKLLKTSLPEKPFAICLAGEWGIGKTSLLKRVYYKLEKEEQTTNTNIKVIWFDAWQYEKLDPVKALIQHVLDKISKDVPAKEKLSKLLKGMLFLTSDIITKQVIDKEMNEILDYFGSTVENIRTFADTLDEAIGDGKLIIFIDDLDRCSIDNVIDMLEAIKLLFNAKKAKFVVGVDIAKLERAWILKHKGKIEAINEGKDHLDKIFQLKLALPPKNDAMIIKYIETITENLPDEIKRFLRRGIPYNPRKIKRALNLAYFISNNIEEKEFSTLFPYTLIWSILTTSFPEISRLVRESPKILIHLCSIVGGTEDFPSFQRKLAEIKNSDSKQGARSLNMYDYMNIPHAFNPLAQEIFYKYVNENHQLYRFLKEVKEALDIGPDPERNNNKLAELERTICAIGLIS